MLPDPEFLSHLIGLAYDAGVGSVGWDAFAAGLNQACPDGRVSMFVHAAGGSPSILAESGWDARDLAVYRAYYASVNPFLAGSTTAPVGQAADGQQTLRRHGVVLEETEYYIDYLKPRSRRCQVAGVVLERDATGFAGLGLTHSHDDPERRQGFVQLLGLLAPHVRRALATTRRIDGAGRDGLAALDRLASPVLLLGPGGSLRWANAAATALLAEADGLTLARDGRLRSLDSAATKALQDLATAAAASGPTAAGGSVALPRRPPRGALLAAVTPLGPDLANGTTAATSMVLITDLDRRGADRLDWLARRFGLTAAETRLVQALVDQPRLDDAAQAIGVTVGTARTRLKQVLAKTDCHRQAELVRLVLLAPERLIAG